MIDFENGSVFKLSPVDPESVMGRVGPKEYEPQSQICLDSPPMSALLSCMNPSNYLEAMILYFLINKMWDGHASLARML